MPSYVVTGSISPNATGNYQQAGTYEGKPYYQRGSEQWYIWWSSHIFEEGWKISDLLGGGTAVWRTGNVIEDDYEPYYGCTGTATVTEGELGPENWIAALQPLAVPIFPPVSIAHLVEVGRFAGDPSTYVEPPIPTIDGWQREIAVPIFPLPWAPEGGCFSPGDPSGFVEPPAITADRFFCPPQVPIFRLPWAPEGGCFSPGDPSGFVTPEPVTADRFFRANELPIFPPPFFPAAGETHFGVPLEWDDAPPLDSWCLPIEQPIFLRVGNRATREKVAWDPVLFESGVPPVLIRYRGALRGLYRIFNAAEYRFYRSSSAPPEEDDTPFATSASLPHTPAETYADGTWYLACSYFNGVLDSGFLPVGPNGERYLRLDLSGGQEVGSPPPGPMDWRLENVGAGVVRILGFLFLASSTKTHQWAIAYTANGSDPPTDSPDVTQAMTPGGLQVLSYDLPAQSHGATVKVRLQTRRNDGTQESPSWVYSEDSEIKSITVDAQGPSAPLDARRWAGSLPEDF